MCAAVRSIVRPAASAAATTGTDCHDVMEAAIIYSTKESAEIHRAELLSLKEATAWAMDYARLTHPNLNGYDLWAIRRSLRWFWKLAAENDVKPEHILTEHRMDGREFGLTRGGTADVVVVIPFKRVIVIDWKFGQVEQDSAADNDQLAAYAIMAARTFTTREVHVWIIQPKIDENDRRETGGRFDAETLQETEHWVRHVCEMAQRPEAELSAGYEQCHYCDALPLCPVAKEYVMNAIEGLELLGMPEDPEEWKDLIDAVKLAEKWAADTKDLAKGHMIKGGRAKGYKLRPGGKYTNLKDVRRAYAIAKDRGMEATFVAACSVKLGTLKELVGPDVLHQVFGELIHEGNKAPTLTADKGAA